MGCLADTLPGYYGLADNIWKYYAKGWGVDYENLIQRFAVSVKEPREKVVTL